MGKNKTFYFTFGQCHEHPKTGEPLKDYYIKVIATDYGKARDLMASRYGLKWAFQYPEEEFKAEAFPKGQYEILTEGSSCSIKKIMYVIFANDGPMLIMSSQKKAEALEKVLRTRQEKIEGMRIPTVFWHVHEVPYIPGSNLSMIPSEEVDSLLKSVNGHAGS